MNLLPLMIFCGMGVAISAKPFAKHYLDMSHQFNNKTIYWQTGQKAKFDLTMNNKILPNTNISYAGGDISAGEHGGTHMDAPYHFNPNGLRIGQIPLDLLQAPAAVIDIKKQAAENPDYMATQEDFNEWERVNGDLPEDAMILFCTGWDKFHPDLVKVLGSSDVQNPATMHFPGVDPQLVSWLVENRKFVGVGIDTVSPDGSATIMTLENHFILSNKNYLILENVKGVCDIPQHGATLLMLPQKIELGSGAPVRIVATWGDVASRMADGARGFHVTNLLGISFLALVTGRMV